MMKEPTIQQLRCFRVLAEELHFGRAARRLHMSQPPVSRQIQALERSLGIQLLERGPRHVELTPAGLALRGELVVALERLDRGIDLAARIANGKAGRLTLAYVEPLGVDLLPRVLGGFRQLQPDIDLRLVEMHTSEQILALHNGSIDCALLRAPANADPLLTFERVWLDELVVALPERHRLAREGTNALAPADLAAESFVVYEAALGIGVLTSTLAACAAAGFTPVVAHAAQSTPMLLALVAAGEGVAMVSREIARVPRPGVRFVALSGEPVQSEVLMGWRSGESSRARDDLKHLIARGQKQIPNPVSMAGKAASERCDSGHSVELTNNS
jgi:DNA-binding transcriptional LysR family regulator